MLENENTLLQWNITVAHFIHPQPETGCCWINIQSYSITARALVILLLNCFSSQACGRDTRGPEGQRGRESTERPGWEKERDRHTDGDWRDCVSCGSAPRQQSNTVNRASPLNLGAVTPSGHREGFQRSSQGCLSTETSRSVFYQNP